MGKKIYLDYAATAPVWPEAVKEMERFYTDKYGNPSSIHAMGEEALKAVNSVRAKIASEIGCMAEEIYFTSGATESNNVALLGLAKANQKKKIVISAIEHASVWEATEHLAGEGFEVVRIGVDKEGKLDLEELKKETDYKTLLVSVMYVNNVIGVVQDLEKIGKICHNQGALFHTDAAQSFGKLEFDVDKMRIDLLSGSSHKIGGPKGVGFLFVRSGIEIEPIMFGGGQERGLRSGTENVPGIAGFGKALEMQKKVNCEKIRRLRDRVISGLEKIGGRINGSMTNRIFNNVHVSFFGVEGETLVVFLSEKGIYISTGSACNSRKDSREDRVLKAIGLSKKEREESIRLSFGSEIHEDDIDFVVREIKKAVEVLRV